jgi:hypothetical protein
MNLRQFVFTIIGYWILTQSILASCLPPPVFQETFEILSCEVVNLNKLQPPPNWQGLSSYQGVILHIAILSNAKKNSQKADSLPMKTQVFYQTTANQACVAFKQGTKRKGIRTAACCDGDPNSPCLLGFSEYVYGITE